MKKLIYLLLLSPIIYLTSCSKSNVTPQSQSLEDVIVGKEWCLSNANEDGFLLAEDGKFYFTNLCSNNTPIGNWIIDGDLITYQYTDNTQEITIIWGEVTEYSATQFKLLDYTDSLTTIVSVYTLDSADIYGCMVAAAGNYNPAAECDDGSCGVGYGCMDAGACNYDPLANIDDGSCEYITCAGCMDAQALNYNPTATIDDGSCAFSLAIGVTYYQGGIIFYILQPGDIGYVAGQVNGLIAAPSDQFIANSVAFEWGYYYLTPWLMDEIPGADGTAIGTGNQNTSDILNANCISEGGGQMAADICANLSLGGYNDWFLPSKDELNEMYLNIGQGNALGLGNIGGFHNSDGTTTRYWSSTERSDQTAWFQDFYNGGQDSGNRDVHRRVRAIRAF